MGNPVEAKIEGDALREASRVIHLIFHRNKNQHRHAHWWKWLSMLKRGIRKLILELEQNEANRAHARSQYLQHILLPRCHGAFSHVVADGQFAALGLVLMAEVGRVGGILGWDEWEEKGARNMEVGVEREGGFEEKKEDLGVVVRREDGEGISVGMVEEHGDGMEEHLGKSPLRSSKAAGKRHARGREDDGMSATRKAAVEGDNRSEALTSTEPDAMDQGLALEMSQSRKKRRKKGANAIDDLFSGLA